MRKANVLPEPVLAWPRRSRPSRRWGIDFAYGAMNMMNEKTSLGVFRFVNLLESLSFSWSPSLQWLLKSGLKHYLPEKRMKCLSRYQLPEPIQVLFFFTKGIIIVSQHFNIFEKAHIVPSHHCYPLLPSLQWQHYLSHPQTLPPCCYQHPLQSLISWMPLKRGLKLMQLWWTTS